MPKFKVRLLETISYEVEVECESSEEAGQEAAEIWAASEDPFETFTGHGHGVEPIDVEEAPSRLEELRNERDSWVLGHPDGTESPDPAGWARDNPRDAVELAELEGRNLRTYTLKLVQFHEEVAEVSVAALSAMNARAIVRDSINRNMLDEEFDLDWSDGDGIHHDGILIEEIN